MLKAEEVRGDYEIVERMFTTRTVNAHDRARHERILAAAKAFGHLLMADTPPCTEQSRMLMELQSTVMWANAAIALQGPRKYEGLPQDENCPPAPPKKFASCKNCAFWDGSSRTGENQYGQCHRFNCPTPVAEDYWCGEFSTGQRAEV